MDEVTQQNASLVEESAAAAEAMQEQARSLQLVVGTFKVDGHSAPTASLKPSVQPERPKMIAKPKQTAVAPRNAIAAKGTAKAKVPMAADEWEEF
jgi:methyl-accepting chemotaxis protein